MPRKSPACVPSHNFLDARHALVKISKAGGLPSLRPHPVPPFSMKGRSMHLTRRGVFRNCGDTRLIGDDERSVTFHQVEPAAVLVRVVAVRRYEASYVYGLRL